ncbi:MAG: hypothetical protein RIR89_262 [Actinomycetota bacterium]
MSLLEDVRTNMTNWLTEEYGEPIKSGEGLVYPCGSTIVAVLAMELNEHVLVAVQANVAHDVPLTGELAKHVLVDHDYIFGSLKLSANDDGKTCSVRLTNVLVADELDKSEIVSALTLIAGTADSIDDELVARFGGSTALA